jgi:Ca2+-binding RTX toxin-like protein
MSNIQGTGKADFLQGTSSADYIMGKGGTDLINGGGGADTLSGGAGFDSFWSTKGSGVDVVVDYQIGETLYLSHGKLSGDHHFLTDGETLVTSTGATLHAYNDADGAAHLEFTYGNGQVDGFVLEHTDVASLFTGWFTWDQAQPDSAGYTAFGGLRAY